MRRDFLITIAIFLALWLGLMLFGRSALLKDPGCFWHVAVGQRMLDSGELVREDPFSFTRAGQPWVAHQWLAECGMSAVHAAGGLDGLVLATAVVLAATFAGVGWRLLHAGFHPLGIGALLALVLATSSPQFHARPLVLSIALMALLFAMLLDVESGRARLRRLGCLVPLFALWANLHGGVLAGIGTLGLAAAGWSAAWLLGRPSPVQDARQVLALSGLVAACCLATLVNPYGLDLPRAWIATLSIPLPGLIEEHGPLDPADPTAWATIALGAGYVVALFGVLPRWPRATWLLPLVWLVLAVMRVRNAPLFAVTAALALADVLPATRFTEWLKRGDWLLPRAGEADAPAPAACRSCAWHGAIAPVLVLAVGLSVQAAGLSVPVVGRNWARLDATVWPVELLPELRRIERENPAGTPIFNELDFGGFLIHHTPGLRVFIDDRCALYGKEFLTAHDRARREDPAQLDRWQAEYGFRHALVATGGPFDRHLAASGSWTIIHPTAPATLYEWNDLAAR
jgi:hypothetical protein